MRQVDNRGLISSKNKDKYADFGKRKPIPGLKHENLFYRKEAEGAAMHLFTGGIYDGKDGVNGGFVGLKGDIPLYDKGKLEVYGGVGNVATAGAKFSHSIWQNDNFALKGYARAEGAVDLFGKRKFEPETPVTNYKSVNYKKNTLTTEEIPCNNYCPENAYSNPQSGSIYHETDFEHTYLFDINNNFCLSGDIFNSSFKNSVGAELAYTTDKRNFEIALDAEVGIKSKFDATSKYNQNCNINQSMNLDSLEHNDDINVIYMDSYSGTDLVMTTAFPSYVTNFRTKESITVSNECNIGGFETKLDLESKLYAGLNGRINYRTGRFQLGAEAGVDYCDKKFNPTFKAGVSYLIGNTPIIHNHGARVLFAKNPLKKDEPVYSLKEYPEAKLNLFGKAQAIDGVKGAAIGLDGKIPLNNTGTAMNISAGIGNIITADFNVSQANPTKWDNISLSGRLGVSGNISLTKKDIYITKEIIAKDNFSHNVIPELEHNISWYVEEHPEWIIPPNLIPKPYHEYNIDENYEITCFNKSIKNASSIKAYANFNIKYKKDNWTLDAGIETGFQSKYDNPELSVGNFESNITSNYNLNDNCIDDDPEHVYLLVDYPSFSGYLIVETEDSIEIGGMETYTFIEPMLMKMYADGDSYIFQSLSGNTQIILNGKSEGAVSFVPKFKPYITPTISAEYDIKDVGTVGAKASLEGASVTFSRRIK